jgi:hypothetical protein
MKLLRTVLVVLTALSVGVLPIRAGPAIAGNAAATIVATQPDCCDHGQPCKTNDGGCQSLPGCTLKCGSVSATIVGVALNTPLSLETARLPFLLRSLLSAPENPPLPPPRV